MSTTNLARDAFDAFYSGEHPKCGQLLEQIGSVKGASDVKVQHNTLVNDYYKSGCADPQALLTQITQAHDRARERDKKDKGRRKRDDDDEETYREDEDLSVLRYNQALLCLQLRQHAQATLILEELFENIEPIDDFLAIKICFLLLELCLQQRDPEQAVAVLAYLEKPNAFLTVLRSERPTAKGIEPRPADEGGNADEAKVVDEAGDDSAGEASSEAPAAAAVELRAETAAEPDSEKEAMAEASDGPLPSLAVGAFLPRHGRAPDTISRAEYRFFCLLYRARLAVALKNTKAAKKDAKSVMDVLDQELRHAPLLAPHAHTTGPAGAKTNSGRTPEEALREALHCQHHAMVNVLKAYMEYTRQNVRKATKLLTLCQFNFAECRSSERGDSGHGEAKAQRARRKSAEDDGEDHIPTDFHPAQDDACSAVFYNNLGCIHFMMHKPNLATFYFQKALRAKAADQSNILGAKAGLTLPGVLATRHWLDRRAEIAYNSGLQMLMCNRPSCAFKCFEQCAPVFRTWPRLWLRLAECCVELHRQSLVPSAGGAGEARDADGAAACAGAGSAATTWSRICGRSPPHGSMEASGGARQVMWSVQGGGEHRRWLLTTQRSPCVGRRSGEEDDSGAAKGDGAAGEAAARDGVPSGEGALVHAAMCLRNVLVLTAPLLAERSGAAAGGADGAADEAAAGAASGNGGGASAAAAQEKAAAATGPGSGMRASKAAASGAASTSARARDLLECEASLLEDAALVKLAYVRLCQHDFSTALRHSRRLLEKNGLLPQDAQPAGKPQQSAASAADEAEEVRRNWAFQTSNLPHSSNGGSSSAKYPASTGCTTLGVLYAAEALLLSGKSNEAKVLLESFIKGKAVSKGLDYQSSILAAGVSHRPGGEAVAEQQEEPSRALCGGHAPSGSLGGLTPPAYLLHTGGSMMQPSKEKEGKGEDKEKGGTSKESGHAVVLSFPPCEFPRLGDNQCMLYTNMAALQIQDGNLTEAEKCCERALQVQPRALGPLRTLVYILLRKGQHAQALQRLKRGRLQGPEARSRPAQAR